MIMDDRPIPLPPRTPTPPPDLDQFQNSPTKSFFDPTSLSPMDENFPMTRYGSISSPGFQSTTLPLGLADMNSLASPVSLDSNASCRSSLPVEDSKGVFNFQPLSLPKASVTKSVRKPRGVKCETKLMGLGRMLVKEEVTSINTAVSPISTS